jgi:hypothetical protein
MLCCFLFSGTIKTYSALLKLRLVADKLIGGVLHQCSRESQEKETFCITLVDLSGDDRLYHRPKISNSNCLFLSIEVLFRTATSTSLLFKRELGILFLQPWSSVTEMDHILLK